MIAKTIPAAKEYSRQLALMNTLGMKHAEIAKVIKAAWSSTAAVPTMTAAQNLESFRELRSAFGSDTEAQGHAAMMLPVVARLAGVMQSLTGKEQKGVGFDMVKAIELRTGVMTTEALTRNSEMMSKAIIGMGGTISAHDFHGTLKMGKMATNKWSDDFVYSYLPTLMQELKTGTGSGGAGGGAQTAGTMLMSLYQAVHGKMTKAAMPLWVQAGLVNQSDIVKNAGGQWQVRPGSVAGTAAFEANPFSWVQNYLRPGVDKIMAKSHVSAETAINSMFGNRNAAFAAYNMYFKAQQYERDKTTIGKADGGYTAYQKLLKTDPTLASAALHAQWQNVLAQIGFSIMPTLIKVTLVLVRDLNKLSEWMHHHPEQVRALVAAFAGLSIVLTVAGGIVLLSAAFSAIGLLAPIIGAVLGGFGAAIAAISWPALLAVGAVVALALGIRQIVKHWDSSKSILENVKFEFSLFFNWLINQARGLVGLSPLAGPRDPSKPYGATASWGPPKPGAPHGVAPKPADGQMPFHPGGGGFRAPGGSPFVAPHAQKQAYHGGGDVYIDGHKAGKILNRHLAKGMEQANRSGTGAFDPGAALAPVGSYA